MKTIYSLLIFVVLLAGTSNAGPADPPQVPPPSDDAAVWYLTAWISTDQALQGDNAEEAWELIEAALDNKPVDPEKLGVVIDPLDEHLEWARHGSTLTRCSWPTRIEQEGPSALLPHLGMIRRVARVLGAGAKLSLQRDDLEGSTEGWLTIYRMAPHAGTDGTLIGLLVSYSIETMAVTGLGEQLGHYDREQLTGLRDRLARLPEPGPIRDAVETERSLIWWFKGYCEKHGVQAGFAQLRELVSLAPQALDPPDEAAPAVTAEQFKAWFEQADGYYLKSAEALRLPYREFAAAQEKLEQIPATSGNPLMALVPAFSSARRSQLRIDCKRGMLDAMIAYRLGGEQAFAQVLDPFDNKPFDLSVTEDGVVVSSRHTQGDKPWSMTFPAALAEPLR